MFDLLCVTTDSDDLKDLRMLLEHVRNTRVLVVVLSKEVLLRPWCLLELYTAINANVPIVAVDVEGRGYDYAEAAEYLRPVFYV